MDFIYSESQINKEIGRIESVKHIEWLLTIFFLFFAFTRQEIDIFHFIAIIIGAQFPDILEGIFFKLQINPQKRRLISHTFLVPVLLIILSINLDPLFYYYFSLAYLGHLVIDLFAGGDPVYLFGPFSGRIKFSIVKREKRMKIGDYVYKKVGYLWSDQTNGDLAWFWILQFFGSVFGAIAFSIYLLTL